MDRNVDIAIIGAGTAGLSAFKEATKHKKRVVLIDGGTLGTTCARVGCMPSKVLIQVAEFFHQRLYLKDQGIHGGEHLTVDIPEALAYVRQLRDHFTSGVVKYTESLGDQLIRENARFIDPNTLQVGHQKIKAQKTIIATGSSSIIPKAWESFSDRILMSENIFEQKTIQDKVAVIGAGVIGLELGQALARLGIDITIYHADQYIGGLTDPKVAEAAAKILSEALSLYTNARAEITQQADAKLSISASDHTTTADQILAALGRRPNIEQLNLEALGVDFDSSGIPRHDCESMQIHDLPIFMAGDVNKVRPLLHEAADEGRIAGYNAAQSSPICFKRRVPIRILFTQPNIASVGQTYQELKDQPIAIGEVDYSDQGRARILKKNQGLLRIYGDSNNGQLLGAEMIAPEGEHLAHLLAWAIQNKHTVFDVLQLPYYHPVIEEGMRTALRDLSRQVEQQAKLLELAICESDAPLT